MRTAFRHFHLLFALATGVVFFNPSMNYSVLLIACLLYNYRIPSET